MIGILVALIGINMWGLLPGLRSIVPQQSSYCSVTNGACRRFAARPLRIGTSDGYNALRLHVRYVAVCRVGGSAGGERS